jgi:hypothetical protein
MYYLKLIPTIKEESLNWLIIETGNIISNENIKFINKYNNIFNHFK